MITPNPQINDMNISYIKFVFAVRQSIDFKFFSPNVFLFGLDTVLWFSERKRIPNIFSFVAVHIFSENEDGEEK